MSAPDHGGLPRTAADESILQDVLGDLGLGANEPLTDAERELLQNLQAEGQPTPGLTLNCDPDTGAVQAHDHQTAPGAAVDLNAQDALPGIDAAAFGRFGADAFGEGQYKLAAACLRLSLRLRLRTSNAKDPELLTTAGNLAEALQALGDLTDASKLKEAVFSAKQRVLGIDHPDTLRAAGNLATVRWAQGDLAGARELEEAVHAALQRVLGPDHPDTLTALNNLAGTVWAQGELVGARALLETVLASRERVQGPEHIHTLGAADNLAEVRRALGDLDGARRLQEAVYVAHQRGLGTGHPDTLTAAGNLAETLLSLGELDNARQLQTMVHAGRQQALGADHPTTLIAAANLAEMLRADGDLDGALQLQERVFDAHQRTLGPNHPDTLISSGNLANTLRARGDLDSALRLLAPLHATHTRKLGPDHPDTLTSANNLAETLRSRGDLDGAVRLQAVVFASRQRVLGSDHPATLTMAHNLAVSLQDLGRLGEAAGLCLWALDVLLQAPSIAASALSTAARMPLLADPSLPWPEEGVATLLALMPRLSHRVSRLLRPLPLDHGAPLYRALAALHGRWCVFASHRLPRAELPAVYLRAIAPLHGPNAWAQARRAAQASVAPHREVDPLDAPGADMHSPVAARYLAAEQALLKTQLSLQDLLQQRNALRENHAQSGLVAPPDTLHALHDQLQALARQNEAQYRLLVEAERRLAEEDPRFADQLRLAQEPDPQVLQDSLVPGELCLLPLPEDRLRVSADPIQWTEQFEECHSFVFVMRNGQPAELVRIGPLQVVAAATRLYRTSMTGRSGGIRGDQVVDDAKVSPTTAQSEHSGQTDDAPEMLPPQRLRFLADLVRAGFWEPLRAVLRGAHRLHLVTGAGQHDLMLECGQPEDLRHVLVHRHCGLPAYRLRLGMAPAHAKHGAAMVSVVDNACLTGNPIPFTELDACVVRRSGHAQLQSVDDLVAEGPRGPILLLASHGVTTGSRSNPSGALMLAGRSLSPAVLIRDPTERHGGPVRPPLQALIAMSCFGGVVGASSLGDAHGVIAALQAQGLHWAVACLAPVPDFYSPVFSAVLHHELARSGVDPAEALHRTKALITRGPWDLDLRHAVLDPLQAGYRRLMLEVLAEATDQSAADEELDLLRRLRLLGSLQGWPLVGRYGGAVERQLQAGLRGTGGREQARLQALMSLRDPIAALLSPAGAAERLVDDALAVLFAGPQAWEEAREERRISGQAQGGAEDHVVDALQTLCAVTVFFGKR